VSRNCILGCFSHLSEDYTGLLDTLLASEFTGSFQLALSSYKSE